MSDLKKRAAKLNMRERKERFRAIHAVGDKYKRLKQQLRSGCIHDFGEWHSKRNHMTGGLQSNWRGDPFYFRSCDLCGIEESKIDVGLYCETGLEG